MTLQVELVSPEGILFEGEADMVIARTVGGGDIAFLTGHVPFVGSLATGVVKILQADNRSQLIAAHRGFVSVANDRVSILSDVAELLEAPSTWRGPPRLVTVPGTPCSPTPATSRRAAHSIAPSCGSRWRRTLRRPATDRRPAGRHASRPPRRALRGAPWRVRPRGAHSTTRPSMPSSGAGNRRSRAFNASTMTVVTTRLRYQFRSAGTTYQGASSVLVFRDRRGGPAGAGPARRDRCAGRS